MHINSLSETRIVVLGSGVVGKATGLGLSGRGHRITFLDINPDTTARLREQGHDAHSIKDGLGDVEIRDIDIVMVCIGTPTRADGNGIDLTYIKEGMKMVAEIMRRNGRWAVVVIRSTVPPTTTESVLIPLIEQHSGLTAGQDFGVCMNPEYLRAASAEEDFANPWATVIGELDQASGDMLERLYQPFGGKMLRLPLAEAEFTKYVNNLRNAVLISFANEMWRIGRQLGVCANGPLRVATETAESAWNPKYGSTGGFPYGGTCLPKDTNALLHMAKGLGMSLPLLTATEHTNDIMNALAENAVVPQATIEGHNWQPSPAFLARPATEGDGAMQEMQLVISA